jgi:hypothetical protein
MTTSIHIKAINDYIAEPGGEFDKFFNEANH